MMIEEVKRNLCDQIRPFWKGLIDKKNGGYYGQVDFELNIHEDAPKGVILNSRILWFFSNSFLTLQEEEDLVCANWAYDYLMNNCLDKIYGGVYWSTNSDGTIMDSTKHTYNQAFSVYALSSYYAATGKKEAIETAIDIFKLIEEKCRDDIGYLEAFDEQFNPIKNDKLSENGVIADKTMNTLLHVFEAYTELYRVTNLSEVKDKLEWIIDVFSNKVYNKEKKRQEVFFDKDMNSILDLHSYGHDIETAWLLDRGLEVLDNDELTKKMEEITRILTKEIYDVAYVDHSVLNECEDGVDNENRIWWVQAEAIVGFINGFQKDNNKTEYLEAAKDIWEYCKEYIIDKRPGGEWFWEVDKNGQPTSRKDIVEPWKCPYHNGRFCFEIIRRNIDA